MEFSDEPVQSPASYYYCGLILFLLIILLVSFLWNIWRSRSKKCYAGPPSDLLLFFTGMKKVLFNNLPITYVMFQMLKYACDLYEKEGMIQVWSFRRILVVYGKEAVKTFATDEASADKSSDYDVIKDILGDGLITSNGETWKKDRKMLNPIFHTAVLKDKLPILNNNAEIMVKKLEKVVDEPISDLLPSMKFYVFHNLCESILEVNMKENLSEREILDLFELLVIGGEAVTMSWTLPAKAIKVLKFFTWIGWKYRDICKRFKRFNQKVLFHMTEKYFSKSSNSKNDEKSDQNEKSIYPILLEPHLKDRSFTLEFVQNHIYTFAAAGIDTVIYTMMWCLFLLGLHKDIQQKVYHEIQSVADGFISYENLSQLEYLECILKETLRLYPTVPAIARYLKKHKQCGKYRVPKNTTILIFMYKLHRNSEIYPDPERFDPDRFRPGNVEKNGIWTHLPFSEGYRNCIGKKFAMMEMKVGLAYILRNYEVTTLDKIEDVELTWKFLLMPTKPLRMRLTRRQAQCASSC